MIIIRPIRIADLNAYVDVAMSASLGITNLPKNRQYLIRKIERSLQSFQKKVISPEEENYIFVLEDLNSKSIGGTCEIYSRTGSYQPLYFYRIEEHRTNLFDPKLNKVVKTLAPTFYLKGPTEVCALCLLPHFRKGGLGRLLSLSRFLFINTHPERFKETIFAEMQGIIDDKGSPPFWEGVGRHFLDISFSDLMHLRQSEEDFIPGILPQWPIYIDLLPETIQEVIGKTHPETTPALNMLSQEGFQFTGEVDLFDAGPKISAQIHQIRTIKSCHQIKVQSITTEEFVGDSLLLSNVRLDFRACYGKIKVSESGQAILHKAIAEALQIGEGDKICYVTPK